MSKSCSESSSTCILCLCETKALARSSVHAGSSEPLLHADVIRTIISCADQFIVLIFHCGPFILFSYSVIQVFSQVNKHTLSYQFLYGNAQGCVFAKNRPVSLNWTDYTPSQRPCSLCVLDRYSICAK